MKTFRDAVREVNFSLKKIALFEITLNTFVILLLSYLILLLFNANAFYSVIMAAIYVVFFSFRRIKKSNPRQVEEKYSALKEKFRTAVENQYIENPVVNELQAEVLRDLRKVEEASFFNNRETYAKVGAIVLLCFLIFYFSPVSLAALLQFDMSKILPSERNPDIELGEGGSDAGAYMGGTEQGGELFGDEDIYGKLSVAQLGDEEMFVEFNPGGYEINIKDLQDVSEVEFEESFPDEIVASSGEVLEESIPKEQQELVKNYFKQLVEEG